MKIILKTLLLVVVLSMLLGCGGGVKPTIFLHPDFNFSFIERVAVVPFENLSNEQGAAYRTTRLFISELFAAEAFEVVEPGETKRVIEKTGTVRTAELTKEQIISVGKELGVQALFMGSVNESTIQRSGTSSNAIVTLVVRMVETETGATIWSATNTETGKGFIRSVFGASDKSMSEVTRNCVKNTLRTLIK
ncbi:MAG: hypothetical protein DWP97_10430 [Calditrichaeota bacterium]|nr:MAG: hypothetical protein DWP97_10430 [Calditrichota bacterium]